MKVIKSIQQIHDIDLDWIIKNSQRSDLFVIKLTEPYKTKGSKKIISNPYGVAFRQLGKMSVIELYEQIQNGICVVSIQMNEEE